MADWGYKTATHTVGSVTTTSGTILAANASRRYALLVNDSDTTLYLSLGGAAVANTGIRISPQGGNYEMSMGQGNLYTGRVEAIHNNGGTKLLLITEGA